MKKSYWTCGTTPRGEHPNSYCQTHRKTKLVAGNKCRYAEQVPETGIKHDSNKIRFDLIPPEFLFALAQVLTNGAEKYADRNWEKGMAWGKVFGACMRHLWCWWGGKQKTNINFAFGDLDSEWQFSHLWHAACCICFLVCYEERKVGTDDRWKYGEGEN